MLSLAQLSPSFFLFIDSSNSRSFSLFSSSQSQEVSFTFTSLGQIADQSITCLIHYFPWASGTSPFRPAFSGSRGWRKEELHSPIRLDSPSHFPCVKFCRCSSGYRAQNSYKKIFNIEGKVPQKFFCTYWKGCSKRGRMEQSAKGLLTSKYVKFRHQKRNSQQYTEKE